MSAQVQAVGFLCLLTVAAGGVTLSVLPSIGRRARQMQVAQQRRETEAREVVETSSTSRFEEELSAASKPAEPNYHRERPAGDTQEWEIQERVVEPEPAAEVVEEPEPVEVVPPTPEPSPWMRVALDDEPTPLAPGPVPQFDDFESFTDTWTRAELLARFREVAKGDQAA